MNLIQNSPFSHLISPPIQYERGCFPTLLCIREYNYTNQVLPPTRGDPPRNPSLIPPHFHWRITGAAANLFYQDVFSISTFSFISRLQPFVLDETNPAYPAESPHPCKSEESLKKDAFCTAISSRCNSTSITHAPPQSGGDYPPSFPADEVNGRTVHLPFNLTSLCDKVLVLAILE